MTIKTDDPYFKEALNKVDAYQSISEVGPGYSREEALDINTGKVKIECGD